MRLKILKRIKKKRLGLESFIIYKIRIDRFNERTCSNTYKIDYPLDYPVRISELGLIPLKKKKKKTLRIEKHVCIIYILFPALRIVH